MEKTREKNLLYQFMLRYGPITNILERKETQIPIHLITEYSNTWPNQLFRFLQDHIASVKDIIDSVQPYALSPATTVRFVRCLNQHQGLGKDDQQLLNTLLKQCMANHIQWTFMKHNGVANEEKKDVQETPL